MVIFHIQLVTHRALIFPEQQKHEQPFWRVQTWGGLPWGCPRWGTSVTTNQEAAWPLIWRSRWSRETCRDRLWTSPASPIGRVTMVGDWFRLSVCKKPHFPQKECAHICQLVLLSAITSSQCIKSNKQAVTIRLQCICTLNQWMIHFSL